MTHPVVLAGPASPAALGRWLGSEDSRRALELPGLGGSALTNLATAFLATGRHVELVTLAPELNRGEVVILAGPRLRILIAPYRPRARHRCADAFRRERRHVRELLAMTTGPVVNAHWTYEFALGATRLPGRATVVTAHDAPFTILRYQRPRSYLALRAGMAVALRLRTPTMTAVSPYLAAAWQRQMRYPRKISVVPNVVSRVTISRAAGEEPLAPTILEVADAGRRKNVTALIRAMPGILADHPNAKLRLAGRGLTRDSPLAALAARLSVGHSVEFLGRVPSSELDAIYREADLFVHAALEEACPMSVAEAMSYELPIVAGERSGGVPWLLDEGRAGLLVDVRKPTAIAEGVVRLLGDDRLRRQLAAAGQTRARSHLSPEAVVAGYLEVYARAEAIAAA